MNNNRSLIMKKLRTSKSSKRHNQDGGVNENVVGTSDNNLREMNTYINSLKLHKQKISAMVENIMETVDNPIEGHAQDICAREKPSEGKPSKMEYGVPLTIEPIIVHDVSHIVIDTFRDYLCRELPGNKRQLFDSVELKEHLSLIEHIRRAEKDVMEVQERLLRLDDKGGSFKLNPWNVEHYSLLCPWMFIKNVDQEKENKNDKKNATVAYGIHTELRQLRLRLSTVRPRLDVQCHKPEIVRKRPVVENSKDMRLFVNTNIVRFTRFMPGSIYKKTIKVINVGKRMTLFGLSTYGGSNGAFDYEYTPRRQLAPGMNAKITVTFKCTSLENVYELVAVTSSAEGDEKTKYHVIVCAENPIPVLQYTMPSYEMDSSCEKPSNQRSPSVCVFECNACLVGASKTIIVMARNVGRSAKFVCVSEDVWYTKSVEDVEWNGSMSMGAFKITPSIFEIDHGQSINLNVMFEPRLQSFYCSRFIIMSDNACAHEVNVFGNGQMFGEDWNIQFEGQNLVQQLAAGSYKLDMGTIVGKTVRYVYAKNTSRIKYQYRWTINHKIVDPGLKSTKVNLNIHPSTGWLDKVSKTMFRVECSVTDEMVTEQLTGMYRVIATLTIDDVPKESISNLDVFSADEYPDYNISIGSSERVSIIVAKIEIISVYKGKERVSLRINPVILDMNWYKLELGSRVSETVDFVNNAGSRPVHVSWTPDERDDSSASVTVEPGSFDVADRATVAVLVWPLRPGGFRRTLRFRARERDGGDVREIAVYVRGTVEPAPEVHVRPAAVVPTRAAVCTAGVPWSYVVDVRVRSTERSFYVQRRSYECGSGALCSRAGDVKTFGPYGGGGTAIDDDGPSTITTTALSFPAPVAVQATGTVSCQLAEWSFAGSRTVRTQAMSYAEPPDVRLNADVITIDASLYRGVSHRRRGIRLLNNMHCDFAYSWGAPSGTDANNMHCALEPANGTVNGRQSIEFELVITPRTTGYFCEYWIPCFVQCDALTPRQLRVECVVKEFNATVTYIDECDMQRIVEWHEKYCIAEHAVEQRVIVRNNAEVLCRVKSKVFHHNLILTSDRASNDLAEECAEFISPERTRHCRIWIEKDDEALSGNGTLEVSVWALATTWGRYEDTISIELHVGADIMPAVHIPLVVHAITSPLEFPLSVDVRRPTVNFSLYSMDSERRLQILNKSKIPIQVSWRIYNKTEQNRPFGVVFDTLTPDLPNLWTFRIDQFYGLESPRYFKIEPKVLKIEPNELGFVTFYLDRASEIYLKRNENNIVCGKAVGIVTALEPSKKYCIRDDGFKLKPAIVKLYSETLHSIQPNLVLRERDNIFQFSATEIYNSQSMCHTMTRVFTMLNLLRYPATVSFMMNGPFSIKGLRSLRCGDCPENAKIRVFYEDLLEIKLQVTINLKEIQIPKMPTKMTSRKSTTVGRLFAHCDNSYFKPKMVATFEVHVYFPILKLSTEYINFGEVVVKETKSINVMLSSYPGPERFIARSKDEVFTISPGDGVVSHMPTSLTISFRPKTDAWYSNKIKISTSIPMDMFYLKVSGFGIK